MNWWDIDIKTGWSQVTDLRHKGKTRRNDTECTEILHREPQRGRYLYYLCGSLRSQCHFLSHTT